jgi:hydroxymethylpyrimidine pyrophosphatase-like HAD family hydrolase
VGHSVAMGQASAEVRAAASWVTSGIAEDGVARALHHLGVLRGRR